ncbi:MAG TPA: DUF2141 domain-containing protein [Cellvibrio sp.]|nr:DUF2141 domain-containing protein [Cellvibrio sp.]
MIALAELKDLQNIKTTFDLPPGEYATVVVQDVNNNGLLDKNWMATRKNQYACSVTDAAITDQFDQFDQFDQQCKLAASKNCLC